MRTQLCRKTAPRVSFGHAHPAELWALRRTCSGSIRKRIGRQLKSIRRAEDLIGAETALAGRVASCRDTAARLAARNRKEDAPTNTAVLRRRALDMVRRDTPKASVTMKLHKAAWDAAFLCSPLNGLAAA